MPFGRPKKFKYHKDLVVYTPRMDTPAEMSEYMSTTAPEYVRRYHSALVKAHGFEPPARGFFPRSPVSFNDPRCVFFVADALFKSLPYSYIRPTALVVYLNGTAPQYFWDLTIVGRILAGIWAANKEAYREYEDDETFVPVTMGRDGQGRYYVVDPKGGNEGRLWLWYFRRAFAMLSEQQSKADNVGEFRQFFGKFSDTEWYAGVEDGIEHPDTGLPRTMGDPIRNQSQYDAQLIAPTSSEAPAMTEEAFTAPDNAYTSDVILGGRSK